MDEPTPTERLNQCSFCGRFFDSDTEGHYDGDLDLDVCGNRDCLALYNEEEGANLLT